MLIFILFEVENSRECWRRRSRLGTNCWRGSTSCRKSTSAETTGEELGRGARGGVGGGHTLPLDLTITSAGASLGLATGGSALVSSVGLSTRPGGGLGGQRRASSFGVIGPPGEAAKALGSDGETLAFATRCSASLSLSALIAS